MLEINDLVVGYGEAEILHNVSVKVGRDSLVALIGANGAGKSTMLKSISGLLRSRNGTIQFQGKQINGKRPDEIIRLGLSNCPEGRRVFPEMTVLENLEMGAYTNRKEISERLGFCYSMFPMLKGRNKQIAGTLSGGEQQMLAIARALMCGPCMIMFDEPSMGLAPKIVEQVADTIIEINSNGIAVLLVEQNAYMALNMADYAYVLETGKIALDGKSEALLNHDHVKKAYLGR